MFAVVIGILLIIAAVNKAVAESITDELIAYQYALRWDGVLPNNISK